jgi:hypothetical protein
MRSTSERNARKKESFGVARRRERCREERGEGEKERREERGERRDESRERRLL